MAKKREKKTAPARPQLGDNVEILSAGEIIESPITATLETNYMPYATGSNRRTASCCTRCIPWAC